MSHATSTMDRARLRYLTGDTVDYMKASAKTGRKVLNGTAKIGRTFQEIGNTERRLHCDIDRPLTLPGISQQSVHTSMTRAITERRSIDSQADGDCHLGRQVTVCSHCVRIVMGSMPTLLNLGEGSPSFCVRREHDMSPKAIGSQILRGSKYGRPISLLSLADLYAVRQVPGNLTDDFSKKLVSKRLTFAVLRRVGPKRAYVRVLITSEPTERKQRTWFRYLYHLLAVSVVDATKRAMETMESVRGADPDEQTLQMTGQGARGSLRLHSLILGIIITVCLAVFLRSFTPLTAVHHPSFTQLDQSNRSSNMTESKFVEILDNSFIPRSHANANLDDVLAETRARSSSASSASSESLASRNSSSSERGQRPTSMSGPLTMRLRTLSLRKPKT
ncbi:hypothetical protein KC327_g67 [Hortaea werneckii]|nr:hypothetical protein KC327_g67 [Hortaea werneckii]